MFLCRFRRFGLIVELQTKFYYFGIESVLVWLDSATVDDGNLLNKVVYTATTICVDLHSLPNVYSKRLVWRAEKIVID